MSDERRKLRQLQALQRLRELQRDQAARAHAMAGQVLKQTGQAARRSEQNYQALMVDYAQRQQSGCELDPGLHEERLLGLLGSREQVLQHQQQESDCRVNVRLRREELLLAQANAGVMDELEKQSAQAWLRLRAVQEQQDIFEAQSRGAGDDGQG